MSGQVELVNLRLPESFLTHVSVLLHKKGMCELEPLDMRTVTRYIPLVDWTDSSY